MNRIVSLSSRKAYGFSLLLGALAALSFPPLHIIITPFIAFPLWLYLLEVNQEKSWKKHFAMGWWFGLGYFTVGLYWITFALGVDIGLFWWLVPFALFGIPTGLGVYLGCMTVLLKLTRSTGLARCFWFAALWTSAELAWGSGPLALPWNPLGVIWSGFEPILQSVSVIGIYGLTLMTALFVSFPILFRKDFFKAKQIIYVSSLAVIFIGATTWGMERPSNTPVQQKDHQPLVRIVQPYIPQDLNWEPAKAREQFHDLVQLSATKAETQPDIWIWPESALPLLLDEDQGARATIAQLLPAHGYLMSGSLRRVFTPGEKVKIYNSFIVVGSDSNVTATYDKFHLVPFGEYLPLRSIIPNSVSKITSGEIDFSTGPGPETLSIEYAPPFSPLICFEGIFSGQVVAFGQKRPEWLINITNDAWYGQTSGPYQHLQLARLRSIEEGIPMVRAANSGISAVFDAFGRELGRVGLSVKGVLDVRLPPALQEPTIFAKYGNLIVMLMLLTAVGLGLLTRRM